MRLSSFLIFWAIWFSCGSFLLTFFIIYVSFCLGGIGIRQGKFYFGRATGWGRDNPRMQSFKQSSYQFVISFLCSRWPWLFWSCKNVLCSSYGIPFFSIIQFTWHCFVNMNCRNFGHDNMEVDLLRINYYVSLYAVYGIENKWRSCCGI